MVVTLRFSQTSKHDGSTKRAHATFMFPELQHRNIVYLRKLEQEIVNRKDLKLRSIRYPHGDRPTDDQNQSGDLRA